MPIHALTNHGHHRAPTACKVCARSALYNYYGVRCCAGCKQFFRRTIKFKKEYTCGLDGRCDVASDQRCCSCRLDKCLSVGMKAEQINHRAVDFLRQIAERKSQLEKENGTTQEELHCGRIKLPAMLVSANKKEFRALEELLRIEERQRLVWTLFADLPAGYLDGVESFEALVQSPRNILQIAAQSSENTMPSFDREEFLRARGFLSPEDVGFMCVDRALVVDAAKALSVFGKLQLSDKICVYKQIVIQISTFLNGAYSASMGADTFTRANGLQFIYRFLDRIAGDKKLESMYRRLLCDGVTAVARVRPSREEFMLLLAILYCNSTATGLSAAGRELLYAESLRYSRLLMNLVQRQQFGQVEGAKRFAECMFLLNTMVEIGHVFERMKDYMGAYYFRRHPEKLAIRTVFPGAMADFV